LPLPAATSFEDPRATFPEDEMTPELHNEGASVAVFTFDADE
jgi:hypothetical protein